MFMDYIRENGVNNTIVRNVVSHPLTTGHAVFSVSGEKTGQYIFSDMLSVYVNTPPLFRFFVSLSHFLTTPVRFVSKMKKYLK